MNRHHYLFAFLVLFMAIAACGTSPQKDSDVPTDAASVPASATTVPTNPQVDESPTAVPVELFIKGPNIANIALLTDTQGVGEKPLLKWDPVTNAGYYQLVVFDADGRPYWAWEGSNTHIYLGGTDIQPPEDSSGPIISNGYSWAVVAFGAEDQIIASSVVSLLSP